jgi:hypothetical protein
MLFYIRLLSYINVHYMQQMLIRNEKVGCSIHLSGTKFQRPELLGPFSLSVSPQCLREFRAYAKSSRPNFAMNSEQIGRAPFSVL